MSGAACPPEFPPETSGLRAGPRSRSPWRTQPRSVSTVQPIFGAIETIASHWVVSLFGRIDSVRTKRGGKTETKTHYLC